MQQKISALTVLAVAALVLTGCAGESSQPGSDPSNPDQLEAMTWWASGDDSRSFTALVDQFAEQNPDIQFIDASVTGGGPQTRAAIEARLASDNPPDTFQATAGAGLSEYIEAGQVQDLTSWYAENGLSDGVFRASVLELLSRDGRIYSVPSDIHRVNMVWANTDILIEAGIDPAAPPATMDAWIADLEKVRLSGVEFPLALGRDWTQAQLFENVLISDLGASVYQNLWTSPKIWEGNLLRTVVTHYARLLDYVDPDSRAMQWDEATQTVIDGEAAYIVMADFALEAFRSAGNTFNEHTAFPTPGTVGVFDLLADSFTLPVDAVHQAAAEKWLLTVSSAEGQKALSLKKGSIPARADTVAEDFPAYQQTAIESLQSDAVVPSLAHGVAANTAWTKAITEALVKFGNDGHAEALINALIAAAHSQLD